MERSKDRKQLSTSRRRNTLGDLKYIYVLDFVLKCDVAKTMVTALAVFKCVAQLSSAQKNGKNLSQEKNSDHV